MKLIKRIACLVLTMACMHLLFAQFSAEEQAQIDSWSLVVKSKSVHDTSVINANSYAYLSEPLASFHLEPVIYLCTKAQKISNKLSHPSQQTNSLVVKTTLAAKNS